MTLFLLIRHADTDWVGRGFSGWLPDVHLNAAGQQQARARAASLGGFEPQALYSSPLERALETAQAIAERFSLPVEACADLGELQLGEWTGRSFDALRDSKAFERFNRFRGATRIPGGETMLEAQARVLRALLELRDRHPDQCVAVVSHSDVLKAALAHFIGMPLDLSHRLQIDPASLSIVVLDADHVQVQAVNR